MIAVEQRQKAGLRAGRPLRAVGLEARQAVLDLGQVEHEVVGPETGPFADRRRLGRLEVGEGQAGQVAMSPGESARRSITPTSRPRTSSSDLAQQEQVGVVGDVAARRARGG